MFAGLLSPTVNAEFFLDKCGFFLVFFIYSGFVFFYFSRRLVLFLSDVAAVILFPVFHQASDSGGAKTFSFGTARDGLYAFSDACVLGFSRQKLPRGQCLGRAQEVSRWWTHPC